MRLFLIRHGETVDNVAQVYAGTKDSALTVHGLLQAEKLGRYLAESGHRFTHIFSSDLQRALKTANAIRQAQLPAQLANEKAISEVLALQVLREQDFGFYEGKAFNLRPRGGTRSATELDTSQSQHDPDFKDVESKESMQQRMDAFLHEYLVPILRAGSDDDKTTVAVVSHGLILSQLWKCFLRLLPANSVALSPEVHVRGGTVTLEYIGGWSNTGYLELYIRKKTTPSPLPTSPLQLQTEFSPLQDLLVSIQTINGKVHLAGLKRTRGVGSSQHDESQKTLDFFFSKKPKV